MAIMPVFNDVLGSMPLLASVTHCQSSLMLNYPVFRWSLALQAMITSSLALMLSWIQGLVALHIGNLDHFAGKVLTNPFILVEVFTCKDGKYAPLTIHGLVDSDAYGGNHTTGLPVEFRLRTSYKIR